MRQQDGQQAHCDADDDNRDMAERGECAQDHLPGHQEHHHGGCVSDQIDLADHGWSLLWMLDNE
jgi:hypothetical protein